jgi:NADH:ubiquinone oxidoreductase subunit 6 (subunit J)
MDASEIVLNVVFYALAAAAIGGAVAVAASKNIVRSAFALLAVLFSAAALYAVMKADFIAAAQVLIYVGGILVLIIFAVMLTHRITDVKLSNESTPGPAAFCACLCLLFSLVVVILFTAKWQRESEELRIPAGGNEVFLRQYQGDGSTGLAFGGTAFEGSVVLAIRLDKPLKSVDNVRFTAVSGAQKKTKAVPFQLGVTKAEFADLSEGDWHWWAELTPIEDKDPKYESPSTKDFTVNRGITRSVARALAGPYLLAFEVVSVLLLAALVGAAFLARKEVRE